MSERHSILNYTTTISAQRTVGEITELLANAKAEAILSEYKDGLVVAVSFRIRTEFGVLTFRLPANVDQVYVVLQRSKGIPSRLRTRDQATRVAWRIVKAWLGAQLALIRAGLASLDQIFLPFAQDVSGATLYERIKEQRFATLTLGGSR
jgi:hypothetical protein